MTVPPGVGGNRVPWGGAGHGGVGVQQWEALGLEEMSSGSEGETHDGGGSVASDSSMSNAGSDMRSLLARILVTAGDT